ncbi:MAG TPA: metallopeptidase TldD-related protein [Gemmatimonadaceae bacterium]
MSRASTRDARPFSLAAEPRRFLSRDDCEALAQRVIGFARGGGETLLSITSEWTGELRWARNRATVAGDRRGNVIRITRAIDGARAQVSTNQTDDETLAAAVRAAERLLRLGRTVPTDFPDPPVPHEYPATHIWSEPTYAQGADIRAAAARALVEPAERAGMLSAGYLGVMARGSALVGTNSGPAMYTPQTFAECSMTVRDPKGTGSGWAGLSSYDWGRIDAPALAARALEKCLASRNPVAIEPGRYTLIMEPQATFALARLVVGSLDRITEEEKQLGPFAAGIDPFTGLRTTKLGRKVLDARITIEHDPMDPDLGVVPFTLENGGIQPYRRATWVDHGVLTKLAYDRGYALHQRMENEGFPNSGSFRMSGGDSSMEEMIRTTRRGLLVTRFSNVVVLDWNSVLATGVTRDGLWLIENGKISRPVKNLRFTESPMFAFNAIEQLGPPERVYSPEAPAIVPAVKVRDFSFTSTVDAI